MYIDSDQATFILPINPRLRTFKTQLVKKKLKKTHRCFLQPQIASICTWRTINVQRAERAGAKKANRERESEVYEIGTGRAACRALARVIGSRRSDRFEGFGF